MTDFKGRLFKRLEKTAVFIKIDKTKVITDDEGLDYSLPGNIPPNAEFAPFFYFISVDSYKSFEKYCEDLEIHFDEVKEYLA